MIEVVLTCAVLAGLLYFIFHGADILLGLIEELISGGKEKSSVDLKTYRFDPYTWNVLKERYKIYREAQIKEAFEYGQPMHLDSYRKSREDIDRYMNYVSGVADQLGVSRIQLYIELKRRLG